jgi:transcriptional regulator with XRE-family HTH domain
MSEKLREARLNAGLTLQDIANKSRVSRTTIEKAETGRQAISQAYAVRIVKALNDLASTKYTVKELDILTGR